MALKLEDWGNILIKHYKNNPDSFYVSLEDIIEGARRHDPEFISKIELSRKEKGSTFTLKELLSRSFARTLCRNQEAMSATDLARCLKKTWTSEIPGADLCIMALLICACQSHLDGIRQNNYYDRLRSFLSSKDIGYTLQGQTSFSTPFFSGQNSLDLLGLVRKINKTCTLYSIPLKIKVNQGEGNRYHYTDTIMGCCLINGTIIERFKRIFGQSGFIPHEFPSDEELISAFKSHYSSINISEDDAHIMLNERDMLLKSLRKAFLAWDGTTTFSIRKHRNGDTITEADSTIERIIVAIIPDLGSKNGNIEAYVYSDANLESNLRHYVSDNEEQFDIQLYNNKSRNFIKNATVSVGAFIKRALELGEPFQLKDERNDCIAVFRPRKFYLFSNCYGIWEETIEPTIGNSYLLMVKDGYLDEVLHRLGDSKVTPYPRTHSPVKGYELFTIEKLKELPNGYRRDGTRQRKVAISNFTYGESVQTVVLDNWRLLVSVYGGTTQANNVRITSTDSKKSFSLVNINDQWILDFSRIRFDSFDRSRVWNLYVDNTMAPGYEFKFGEFELPKKFRGMSLTIDGEINTDGDIYGLELSQNQIQYGHIVDATRMSVEANATPLPSNSTLFPDTEADTLLYALSSMSYDFFSLKEIECACAVVSPQLLTSIETILTDWFVLGYINIGHESSSHKYVANKPTMVLLTPDYTPAGVEGVRAYSVPHFTCMLTGGRNRELLDCLVSFQSQNPGRFSIEFVNATHKLPHTVLIHSKNPKVFKEISNHLDISFNQRVYAPAMFAGLPSISEYVEEAYRHTAAYSGEALTYDIEAIAKDLKNSKIKRASSYKHYHRGATGFNIYSVYGRKIGVMTDEDGYSYHVGRNWGLWIQAFNQNVSLIRHNGNELSVPGVTPLPRIYQRALCLIKGRLPHYDKESKSNIYHLASNPTATGQYVTAQGIMTKLVKE